MKNNESPAVFNGYYSTEYTNLVEPRKIWSCSKYFLRRWGPILEPNRFWTVIAARHLSYLNNGRSAFQAYDKRMAGETHVSRRQVIRLKQEMLEATPLAVFLTRKPTRRSKNGGLIKTEITDYAIRLDTPLTPADALDVSRWVQAELRGKGQERIESQLQLIIGSGDPSLLIPPVQARIEKNLVTWKGHTVSQLFNHAKLHSYLEAADQIHQVLTGSIYVSTQYFRSQWVPILGAGAAFLISWLRSYCYAQDDEVRNQLTIEKANVADQLHMSVKNLSRYLSTLEDHGFIVETGRTQTAAKKRLFTFQINLLEPLTPDDLAVYRGKISSGHNVTNEERAYSEANGQFGVKEESSLVPSGGQIVTNFPIKDILIPNNKLQRGSSVVSNGQDGVKESPLETTGQNGIKLDPEGSISKGTDVTKNPSLPDKLTQPSGQLVTGQRTDWPAFNTFKFLQSIQKNNSYKKWMDGWNLHAVNLPFHLVMGGAGGNEQLLEIIGLSPDSEAYRELRDVKISTSDLMASWLQIMHEPRDRVANPIGLFVYRIKQGQRAETIYLEVAEMSWGNWLTSMILSQKPELQIDYYDVVSSSEFKVWLSVYRDGIWPFSLKSQVQSWLELMSASEKLLMDGHADIPCAQNATVLGTDVVTGIWEDAKTILKPHMGEMFDIFLAESEAVLIDGQTVTLAVKDTTTLTYLQNQWLPLITQVIGKITGEFCAIQFVVSDNAFGMERGGESNLGAPLSDIQIQDEWEQVLAELELAVRPALFQQVFKGSFASNADDGIWTIELKDGAAAEVAQTRLHGLVSSYINQILDIPPLQLNFIAQSTD